MRTVSEDKYLIGDKSKEFIITTRKDKRILDVKIA